MISKGIIDIGLVRNVIPFKFKPSVSLTGKSSFIVGKDHPFVDKNERNMEDLHNEKLINFLLCETIMMKN